MSEGTQTLHHAVRPRVLAVYLGQLALVLALLSFVPFLVSLYYQDYQVSLHYLPLLIAFFLFYLLSRRLSPARHFQVNEALSVVALAFVLAPLFSAFTLTASGLSWEAALFEAVSAITTTGLTTLEHIHDLPQSLLFDRQGAAG